MKRGPGPDLRWLAIFGASTILAGYSTVHGVVPVGVAASIIIGAWLLTRRETTMVSVVGCGVVCILVAVPVLRLNDENETLQVAVPAAVLGLVLLVALRRTGLRQAGRPAVIALLIVVLEAVSTAWADDINQWQNLAITGVVTLGGVLVGSAVAVTGVWYRLRALIVWLASAEAAYAVVEVWRGLPPLWRGGLILPNGQSIVMRSQLFGGFQRAQGTLGHPLPLAGILLVGLALVLRDHVERQATRRLMIPVLLAGILATGSRSAMLLAAALVMLRAGRSRLAIRVPFMVGGALVAGALAAATLDRWFAGFSATGSFSHRTGAIDAAGRLFTERDVPGVLLGGGAASGLRLYQQGLLQADGLIAVDNQFVLTFAEVGLIGLALLVIVLTGALLHARAGVRAALVVSVIQFAVFDALAWPSTSVVIWLLVGVAYAGTSVSSAPRKISPASPMESVGPSR